MTVVGHKQMYRNYTSTIRQTALGMRSARGELAASKDGQIDEC
jgi:hypothetical protein